MVSVRAVATLIMTPFRDSSDMIAADRCETCEQPSSSVPSRSVIYSVFCEFMISEEVY